MISHSSNKGKTSHNQYRQKKRRVEYRRVEKRREEKRKSTQYIGTRVGSVDKMHATRRPESSKAKHSKTKGKQEKSVQEEDLSKMLYIRLLMSFDDGAVLCTDRSASIDMRSPLKTRETCLSLAGCATMT